MPFAIPGWTVVALVLVLLVMAIVISLKRMRAERRLMRTVWKAETRE